jgi:hypothetical protein
MLVLDHVGGRWHRCTVDGQQDIAPLNTGGGAR